MAKRRTLVIGLDGYDIVLADVMMRQGALPHMAALRERSARFALDHGRARYSGLAWEHVSTGLTPEAMERFAAVDFDTTTYKVRQRPTNLPPVLAEFTGTRTVVFDMPYCDLGRAPGVRGLTTWGAHDPGVAALSTPPGLHDEITSRFGPYPAAKYIYGFVWPDPAETARASQALCDAVRLRTRCATWLLKERLPDWDLAFVVVSEAHSGIEMLWHGVDSNHLLHDVPSALPARQGLCAIYQEIDRLIGALVEAFPDADIVTFSMHGMGINNSDLPGMVLLPELLFRHRFSRSYLKHGGWRVAWTRADLQPGQQWWAAMDQALPRLGYFKTPDWLEGLSFRYVASEDYEDIEWMPATRYRPFWPLMDAFAVPAFYDGRVRINLAGREAAGRVAADQYDRGVGEIIDLVRDCRDPATGKPVVEGVFRAERGPYRLDPSQADVEFTWNGAPTGFVHPRLGVIGPLLYRRPGGHSVGHGFAYIAGEGWTAGDHGLRSSFDVRPTIAVMQGESDLPARMSGTPIDPARPSASPAGPSAAAAPNASIPPNPRQGEPRISAVVCTYDRYGSLAAAVDSLRQQTLPKDGYEIIVVDNFPAGSGFSGHRAALDGVENIRYVAEPTAGLSVARNRGLLECRSDIVAFMDDDAIADSGWLAAVLAAFDRFGDAAAVVGGPVRPLWEVPRPPWLTDSLLGYLSIVEWGGDAARPAAAAEWFAGTNVAYRTSVLRAHGGFAVGLGRNGETTALLSNEECAVTRRIRAAGLQLIYAPDAVVSHRIPAERLNQAWVRKRAAWQAVSNVLMDGHAAEANALQLWNALGRSIDALPADQRSLQSLFSHTHDAAQFRQQLTVIQNLASLLLCRVDVRPDGALPHK